MKTEPSPRPKGDKPDISRSTTRKQDPTESHHTSLGGSIGGVSEYVLEQMNGDIPIILPRGDIESLIKERPGSTTSGVDIVQAGALVGSCTDESDLLEMVNGARCKIIKSVRPGSRHLFERGDECVTPSVLKGIGKENIILIATHKSLASHKGEPLIVDTGDPELDVRLSGFYSVSTGHGRRAIYKAVPWIEGSGAPED